MGPRYATALIKGTRLRKAQYIASIVYTYIKIPGNILESWVIISGRSFTRLCPLPGPLVTSPLVTKVHNNQPKPSFSTCITCDQGIGNLHVMYT